MEINMSDLTLQNFPVKSHWGSSFQIKISKATLGMKLGTSVIATLALEVLLNQIKIRMTMWKGKYWQYHNKKKLRDLLMKDSLKHSEA